MGVRIVVSRFILKELREKMLVKARLSHQESEEVVAAVKADPEVVEAQALPTPVCRDADDDSVLATALVAKPDALVTGNKGLLVRARHEGTPILIPRDCLPFMRKGRATGAMVAFPSSRVSYRRTV